ncbi:MAG: tyrosine--tRNA ligase [Planctomycetota bacterium]|nr:tyrosine--tRNA ligase [Planctomycetota bacterium]
MPELTEQQLTDQVDLLTRGAEALYTESELRHRLAWAAREGRPLRVKLGMDPTSPDIHVGHVVQLRQIRKFQDLGHKAVLIIGDYTARIGDPSGVNKTRPVLSGEQIDANAATYVAQLSRVLDPSPEKLEVRRNSEWLSQMSFEQVIRLCSQMTVARMMERDTFELRFKDGVPIGVHEFLYPFMQGYDSVCIHADVELGGSDQTFNNLVGRTLQENAGQKPQIVMIFPLMVGLDGVQKMSKSKGNYIGITDEPNDMFGKVMSIPDALMGNYFELGTELSRAEIAALVDPAQTHPRKAKAELARLIVSQYHGPASGAAALAEFDRVFSQGNVPTDMPEIPIPAGAIPLVDLITLGQFADSRGEARRLIQQNAVSLDDVKISDIAATVTPATGQILRVGKRRFGKIVVQ